MKHLHEKDDTNKRQFQEMGRGAAQQVQHINLEVSCHRLDMIARQRRARRSRSEFKQVRRE